MGNVAIVVASHGEFAKYALDSAQMIVGKQENCGSMSVTMDLTLDEAKKNMAKTIDELDCSNGLVILVDIFGGTPSNVSGNFLLENDNILVISGLNLPMLIELLLNRDKPLDQIALQLEEAYKQGFTNINKLFEERGEEDDECQIL